MTREEAIYRLKNMAWLYGSAEREQNIEAIDMSIEALQTLEAVEKIKTEVLPQTEVYEDYEHATLVDIKEPLVKHDREWIIGCIKHDGFIKTDRFDKANQIILDALQFAEHFDLLKEHESLQKVVRCKDCRYRFYDKYNECFMCEKHEYGESFEDDDFCSWGERR